MRNLFPLEPLTTLNDGRDSLKLENEIRNMLRGITVAEAISVLQSVLASIEHCGIIPLDDNEFRSFREQNQNSASSSLVG